MLLMTLLAMHGCTEIKPGKGDGTWGGLEKKPHWILKIFLWFPAGLLECYYGRSSLWEGLHTQEFPLRNSSSSWRKAIGWTNLQTAPMICECVLGADLAPFPIPSEAKPTPLGSRLLGHPHWDMVWPSPGRLSSAHGCWVARSASPCWAGDTWGCSSGVSPSGQVLLLLWGCSHALDGQ